MSINQSFKITYHLASGKRTKYTARTSFNLSTLKSYVSDCLFNSMNYPKCEIRLYWLDGDKEEIDIVTEEDFYFFYQKYPDALKCFWHLHVAEVVDQADKTDNVNAESSKPMSNTPKVPPADGSYEFAVHDHVECDGCLMAPIVGFRYKCIQCPNYDLCQNCESKHVHSEHMMVRMPTNNCPSVVEAYITGHGSGRKHGKRSKASCPFVKKGLTVIIDDDDGDNINACSGGVNAEQSTSSNSKERQHGRRHHRRHQRNNFLAHLYDMMHDLAEGGGAAAAAHATGVDENSSSKTTKDTSGANATTNTNTTYSNNVESLETESYINAALSAAQKANEQAIKAADLASKVAHEIAIQTAKNVTESMLAPTTPTAPQTENAKEMETNAKDKVDATTSPCADVPVVDVVVPHLENFTQFLDPQYMRTGMQILNNFSNMFAKMLDPLDNEEENSNNKPSSSNMNSSKTSTMSTESSVSSNLNDLNDNTMELKEKSIEKEQNKEETPKENPRLETDASSNVDIEDIGSDSESDSVSDSFVKLDAPKHDNATKSTTANTSAQTTPTQSLNKSNVMNFAQLSADLRAHIAEEVSKDSSTSIETGVAVTEKMANSIKSESTTTPDEKRAVPVYHTDANINSAVHAMIAMGFSNEGAWLTQLLESVNGNIPAALDLMPVARSGDH